jgi:hypothetical protein
LNTLDKESVMEAKIKFCGSRECDEGIEQSNMRMLSLTC